MTEHMNGAQALIRTLVDAGVDTCFMNPGTSEMHFVAALDSVPDMHAMARVETIDDEPPPSRYLPSIVPPPRLGTVTPFSSRWCRRGRGPSFRSNPTRAEGGAFIGSTRTRTPASRNP